MSIAFADETPQENGVFRNLHMLFSCWQKREGENPPEPYGCNATTERQAGIQQSF
jgi:hypothetical protein